MNYCDGCDKRENYCYEKYKNESNFYFWEFGIVDFITKDPKKFDQIMIESNIKESCYLAYAEYLIPKMSNNPYLSSSKHVRDGHFQALVYYLSKRYGDPKGEVFKKQILDEIHSEHKCNCDFDDNKVYINTKNTEKTIESKARVGQENLRKECLKLYNSKCVLCNINNPSYLVTSHIKPWSECNDYEKLDKYNTLLLCEIHDKGFELGDISFNTSGELVISNYLLNNIDDYNLKIKDVGSIINTLNKESYKYLKWHLKNKFIKE
ncbi:HNH endonuclease [Clostridium manihotivorum]|uniref:HNH nuclease domain-containing protein n=1 Tax=Clostridium manihotivorum TaxID=2320868 RepID=A0A410DY09_9CLOT|nr:HNH endonuclease [Clostridium manihotivorum]QAA34093.1 hypothetical protein C1I91_22055 [Clostridium manihotivorum]